MDLNSAPRYHLQKVTPTMASIDPTPVGWVGSFHDNPGPSQLIYLDFGYTVVDTNPPKRNRNWHGKGGKHKCLCEMRSLLMNGCKCGGI